MLLDPHLRIALLVGIWLLLSVILTLGISRWFRWMKEQKGLDEEQERWGMGPPHRK